MHTVLSITALAYPSMSLMFNFKSNEKQKALNLTTHQTLVYVYAYSSKKVVVRSVWLNGWQIELYLGRRLLFPFAINEPLESCRKVRLREKKECYILPMSISAKKSSIPFVLFATKSFIKHSHKETRKQMCIFFVRVHKKWTNTKRKISASRWKKSAEQEKDRKMQNKRKMALGNGKINKKKINWEDGLAHMRLKRYCKCENINNPRLQIETLEIFVTIAHKWEEQHIVGAKNDEKQEKQDEQTSHSKQMKTDTVFSQQQIERVKFHSFFL